MPDLQWYTKQGPDEKWYKTQATSPDEAVSKMQGAWAKAENAKPLPASSMAAKLGSLVPEGTEAPLAMAQKYLVDPFEKMAAKGGQVGREIGQNIGQYGVPTLFSGAGPGGGAVGGAVGEVAGSMVADPRNWPLLGESAARPLLQKIVTRGFLGMTAKGTYDAAKDLYENWAKLSPTERLDRGTKAGLSAAMTGSLAYHIGTRPEGVPAPKPEETPIAATGKTEAELKTPPVPDIKAKIAQLKADIAKVEAARKPAVEPPKVPQGEDTVEAIRRGAPDEVKPPAAMPNQVPEEQRASVQIKKEAEAKMASRLEGHAAEKKEVPRPVEPEVAKAPEARVEPVQPHQEVDSAIKAWADAHPNATYEEFANAKIYLSGETGKKTTATIRSQAMEELGAEGATWWKESRKPFADAATKAEWSQPSTLQAKQMEMKRRVDARGEGQASVDDATELIKANRKAKKADLNELRSEAPISPPVGREAAPPETAKPDLKPLPPTQTASGSREPVRAAEKPTLDLPAIRVKLINALVEDHKMQPRDAAQVADRAMTAGGDKAILADPRVSDHVKTILQLGQKVTERLIPESEPRSVLGDKGSELSQRPPVTSSADLPAPKRVLNPQERLQLQRDRVVELQKKYPNISKTRLAEMAAEQLRKEQGSLGGDLGGDRRVRREEKINAWIKMIQDPKASAEAQQTAFKMLKAFGVEDDEIIRRASGAEEFAKTEGDRLPEPSPEALSERIGDPREFSEPRPAKEQERSHLEEAKASLEDAKASLQEAKAEFGAQLERHKIGEPDISGVKSPAVEELDRMYKLKDQRGSLSFRRLSPEEKSEASPVSRLLDGLANVFDKIASRIEHPRLTDEQFANRQVALNVLRNATATKALEEARLVHILHDIIQRHDNPINERQNYVDFMDAAEGKPGAKFLQPEDQAVADELKQMYKDRWPRIAEVKGWDEGGAVENYLSRLWSDPKKAERLLNGIVNGKRPLEGYPAFTHERVYKYASEAMAHGLEPITWNPIRQQLAGLFQVDKFLMAHEQVKAPLKDVGLVKWYKHGGYGDVPSGWTRIDDKIFNPKSPTPEGLLERGAYFAPAEVAEVVNRYLGPGLERSQIYRGIRHYSNLLNAATLGLSGYHGAMISWVSQTSDVALGLQRLSRGESGGARDLLRGSIGGFILQSVRQDYRLGKAIQAQALDPITEPGLQRYVDNLTRGGGRIQQDATYALKEREGFMNWLRLGAKGRFDQMLGVGLDKATAPIMKKFVPRIKLGIAGRMMEAKMRELNKLGIDDQHTINTELGKIWDSVDNRAGQMVQDNLSWNPIAKDLANVAIRAVGWDFGSLREYGGAIGSDTSRQFGKILRGQRPELTARMAFTIATPITVGLMGGAIHYYMTGKMPSKVEDCIFPGPDGAKISWPNYAKDMYNFTRAPLKTAIDKLHPTWAQAYEGFWSNADFYGTEIRHPGDPLFKQGIDALKWYSTSWTPLGIRGIQKRMERGEAESSGTGLFGFMPAPQTIGQSKAEELAGELARRRFQEGPRSAGDADRYSLVRKFQFQVANGTLDKKALVQAWQAKRLQDSDVNKIYSAPFKAPKLVVEFKDLKLPDALAVMRDANPNERVQLAPYLLDKYSEINNYPDDQARQYVKQINSYIGSQN